MRIHQLVLLAAGSLVMHSMHAKPLVWYHFNEKAVGQKPTGGALEIVNAANPGTFTAYAKTISGTTLKDDAGYLPVYDTTFGPDIKWIDGDSGIDETDKIGFSLQSSGGDGSGNASLVLLDDNPLLHLQKFTVEFFVRIKPGVKLKNQSVFCSLRNGSNHLSSSWQIRINTDGTVQIYVTKPDATGNMGADGTVQTYLIRNPSVLDGGWHHVALTCDGANLRVYTDYVLRVNPIPVPNGIAYPDDAAGHTLTIGGTDGTSWGRFQGWVDEFRFSDEALEPEQFVRMVPTCSDRDTLVYISCERVIASSDAENVNEIPFALPATPSVMNGGKLPTVVDDTPGENVRPGLFADADANPPNDAAYQFEADDSAESGTPGRTALIRINDVSDGVHTLLTNDELTIEMFINPATLPTWNKTIKFVWGVHCAASIHFVGVYTDGKLQVALAPANGSASTYVGPVVRDGKWHHIALVVDKASRAVYLYVDYVLNHTWNDFEIETAAHTGSYFKPFNFGAAYNVNQASAFRGMMDEIRVTKRALLPKEFLTTKELAKVPSPTVLYASFDGNAKTYPFPNDLSGGMTRDAAYVRNVPGQTIPEKVDMGLAPTNESAIALKSGQYVDFGHNIAVEGLDTQTVEFFARVLPDTPEGAALVCMDRVATAKDLDLDDNSSSVNWMISVNSQKSMAVRIDNELAYNQAVLFNTPMLTDGKWHHYAVTFAKTLHENALATEIHAYADGVEVDTETMGASRCLQGVMCHRLTDGGKLQVGKARGNDAVLCGRIDELRISDRVLTPAEFMHAIKNPIGFMLLLR